MLTQLEQKETTAQVTPLLLQGVLEGITDGILILSEQGEVLYHNYYAHCICQQLSRGGSVVDNVPEVIWRSCQALIESRSMYVDQPVVIESEITLSESKVYRLRVRWLTLEDSNHPYLIVLLEDRCQSIQNRAFAEVLLYNLTPRQAEVWLLRRAGFSYQQIATELYITINTVKRHLKEIYTKQKIAIEPEYQVAY
ncbi:LuxR C-terminal-related transcriptional regulator [Leptothermofonsia sp. ETS-13]|uniref:LuxR C-terminal-related transcriptional regulator n=1 Tax=Leptothermofonsia sp. ETS-13 TaxID=3035696 RepID=UPI003BA37462